MKHRLMTRVKQTGEAGFTLIELLIVIVILGILAGIVVFAVGNARSDSVVSSCKADKKSVSVALEAYKAKTGAYPIAQSTALNTALVPDYLKTWPGGAEYSLTTGTTGAITVAAGTATGSTVPTGC